MATQEPPQRVYRTACPNCGAPVEFRSAASAFAVCSFCRSTLVRDGAALRRIGVAAELFADHSPLQLGVAGRYLNAAFTLVGRLQLAYDGGVWSEWQALFDGGDSPRYGWLSEDNGRYVLGFEARLTGPAPAPSALVVGTTVTLGGQAWTVGSAVHARIAAAEGEFAAAPATAELDVVELRNERGEVASLEYRPQVPPRAFIGRAVELSALDLRGLKHEVATDVAMRSAPCPQCGAPLAPTLASTKSIVCGQCHAVVDVSQGLGAELAYYAQHEAEHGGLHSQIELGTSGRLALGGPVESWQVVGCVERATVATSDADEIEYWREYLLYQRTRGFAFLVDANDGWSWTAPLAGAPKASGLERSVQWQGVTYHELYRYTGRATFVLGEFYWNLAQGETTANIDYADHAGFRRLNREQTDEVIWSGGETLEAAAVAAAFGITEVAPLMRDTTPIPHALSHVRAIVIGAIFVLLLIGILAQCSSDRCRDLRATYGAQSEQYLACARSSGSGAGFRSYGGAFGGASSAGGHK